MFRFLMVFVLLFGVAQARTSNVELAANIAPKIEEVERLPFKERIEIVCAGLAAYRETRSEPFRDQALIASLVYTRAERRSKNTCEVIAEPHQFPWAAHSAHAILPSIKEREAWNTAQRAALVSYKIHPHVEYTVARYVFKTFPGIKIYAKSRHVVFYNIVKKIRHHHHVRKV